MTNDFPSESSSPLEYKQKFHSVGAYDNFSIKKIIKTDIDDSLIGSIGDIHYSLFSKLKSYWMDSDDATRSIKCDIDRSSDFYVAFHNDVPVGYTVLRLGFSSAIDEIIDELNLKNRLVKNNATSKEIEWIGVDNKYSGVGVGSKLLDHILLTEKNNNTSAIAALCWCGSNKSAVPLFNKKKFAELAIKKEYFLSDSSDAKLMLRRLS